MLNFIFNHIFLVFYTVTGMLWFIYAMVNKLIYYPDISVISFITNILVNTLLWPFCLVYAVVFGDNK